jgi:TolB-like protein
MVQPLRVLRRPGPSLVVALSLTLVAAVLPSTAHARRAKAKAKAKAASGSVHKRAPKILPNQEGKIVVFPFRDDEDNGFSAQVERLLKARGLDIVTGVRRVDTAENYREIATTMGIVAFVDGSLKERGTDARVTIEVRSGYTGRKITATTFRETKLHVRADIEDKLWTKIGPAMARACADADKPRLRNRGPLVIEAGTPLAATDTAPRD